MITPDDDGTRKYIVRGGKSQRAGFVFEAWSGGDLKTMLLAVDCPAHPVDRHHLLNCIVEQTYRLRSDPAMAHRCERFARQYFDELPSIWPALVREWKGHIARILVFETYCKLLVEQQRFESAVAVCDHALRLGLDDGTKGGFKGRRARVVAAEARSAMRPSTPM